MKAAFNPPMAIFGLVCAVVATAVLAGARDVAWSWAGWAAPIILIGLGATLLAAVLRRH